MSFFWPCEAQPTIISRAHSITSVLLRHLRALPPPWRRRGALPPPPSSPRLLPSSSQVISSSSLDSLSPTLIKHLPLLDSSLTDVVLVPQDCSTAENVAAWPRGSGSWRPRWRPPRRRPPLSAAVGCAPSR